MGAKANASKLGLITLGTIALAPDLALAVDSASGVRLAYIDPGSGSFILQAIVAAIAGAAVAINAYWRKIKQILGIGSSEAEEDSADSDSSDA